MTQLAQFKIPGSSGGQKVIVPSGLPKQVTGGLDTTGKGLIQTGYQYLFLAAIVLAILFIFVSGIQMITSGGDSEKLQAAKLRMFYAIGGLVVVILAFVIISAVLKVVGVNPGTFLKLK